MRAERRYNEEIFTFDPRKIMECLAELVELKIMHDNGTAPEEYKRRKHLAWKAAFKALNRLEEPKP